MPGLRLTFAQACRLWHLDPLVCEAVLHELLAERFVTCTPDGAFIALPTPRAAASMHATAVPPQVRLRPTG